MVQFEWGTRSLVREAWEVRPCQVDRGTLLKLIKKSDKPRLVVNLDPKDPVKLQATKFVGLSSYLVER